MANFHSRTGQSLNCGEGRFRLSFRTTSVINFSLSLKLFAKHFARKGAGVIFGNVNFLPVLAAVGQELCPERTPTAAKCLEVKREHPALRGAGWTEEQSFLGDTGVSPGGAGSPPAQLCGKGAEFLIEGRGGAEV